MIYTMNVTEQRMREMKYAENLAAAENYLESVFSAKSQIINAFNTYQFTDYSKYRAGYWNEPEKKLWRQT
jgi:hypothetical protein